MKRISFFLFTIYFSAICIQQHTAAQQYAAPAGDNFRQEGIASWYGYEFDGRPTASGEIYNSSQLTAAHPSLPFGTYLLVTNRQNNRQVAVKVNDRGPFVPSRIIDVSRAAAEQLDMLITGTAPVTIEKLQSNQVFVPSGSQPPSGYYLPQQAPQMVYPQQVPQTAYPQQQPMYPQQQVIPRLPPMPMAQPMLPPQAQGPNLIPTPPPMPPAMSLPPPSPAPTAETPSPAAAPYAPITVTVYPPPAQTPPSVQTAAPTATPATAPVAPTAAPNRADSPPLPGPARARLSPAITPAPNKTYKLQVGSYKVAGNAVDTYVKLRAAGLEPSYERNADYFRVVLAGVRGTDVTSVTEKLGTAGFKEAVIKEEN